MCLKVSIKTSENLVFGEFSQLSSPLDTAMCRYTSGSNNIPVGCGYRCTGTYFCPHATTPNNEERSEVKLVLNCQPQQKVKQLFNRVKRKSSRSAIHFIQSQTKNPQIILIQLQYPQVNFALCSDCL